MMLGDSVLTWDTFGSVTGITYAPNGEITTVIVRSRTGVEADYPVADVKPFFCRDCDQMLAGPDGRCDCCADRCDHGHVAARPSRGDFPD